MKSRNVTLQKAIFFILKWAIRKACSDLKVLVGDDVGLTNVAPAKVERLTEVWAVRGGDEWAVTLCALASSTGKECKVTEVVSLGWVRSPSEQNRRCTYIMLRGVRATIVVVGKQ